MQATIEREVSAAAPRRCAVIRAITQELVTPYRAPMATFLNLVASARASANRDAGSAALDREMVAGAFSSN